MARRAKGLKLQGRTRKAEQSGGRSGRVKILSGQASTAVGRPGFKSFAKTPLRNTKLAVRRLMRNDPSIGRTQPGANVITDNPGMDLVKGTQNPEIHTARPIPPSNVGAGKRVIPPRKTPSIKKR